MWLIVLIGQRALSSTVSLEFKKGSYLNDSYRRRTSLLTLQKLRCKLQGQWYSQGIMKFEAAFIERLTPCSYDGPIRSLHGRWERGRSV